MHRELFAPRTNELPRVTPDELTARLGELPEGQLTCISVARYPGEHANGDHDYARLSELGGFHAAGAITADEIVRRYGSGSFRVSAYEFDPGRLRWEVLVDGLVAG